MVANHKTFLTVYTTDMLVTALKRQAIFFILCIFLMSGCKQDKADDSYTLRIRIKEDVDCLHPIISRSTLASQIESLVMLPMIEFSMDKIELTPLLVVDLPKMIHSNDSADVFDCEFRHEAVWEDGSPILAEDYAFTVKAALNPFIKNPSWKSYLKNIKEIVIDKNAPRHLSIHVQKNYLLAQEICGNINIYQQGYYDPEKLMSKFSVYDLIHRDSLDWSEEEKMQLQKFALQFETAGMCKQKISGSGPYKLISWEAGAKIILEKKQNWWGNTLAEANPLLKAYPDRIEYLIIPDEAATLLALKEGTIDLATDMSPQQFVSLQQDSSGKNLQFFSPTVFQYVFLELNHRQPALADRAVRKALAQLIDVPAFIKNVMYDLAVPIIGPLHPSRSYYHKSLTPVKFNPESALQELQAAGWKDQNKDGILDKMINGKSVKLSFSLLVTSETAKKLALLLQDEAKKTGIEIKPEIKDWSLILKDLNSLQFDMVAVTQSQSPSLYDPYQSWHSSNTKAGGANRCGFATTETDSLIQIIRSTASESERNIAYLRFQEILYNEQAQLFLFSPKLRLVASNRIKLEASSRRPGYAENMIQLAK